MITKFVAGFSAITILSLNLFAANQVKTSVDIWSDAFNKALTQNQTKEVNDLLNFTDIESKVVPKCLDCDANEKILQARQSYEKNDLSKADKLYNEIPKSSDFWLEAVEERGWLYFRQEQFEKSMSQTKTLLSPQFASIVNSEAFLLQALNQLQICDYEGVLKTNNQFKETQKNRISEIQNLAKSGKSKSISDFLDEVNTFPLDASEFSETLGSLPLLFYRDLKLQKAVLNYKLAEAGLDVSDDLGNFKYKNLLLKIKNRSFNQLTHRMKELAQSETNKNFKIVQDLNLVEVEVIQRIHTDLDIKDKLYSKESNFKDVNQDQLVFMDDGHPWIDELDKYEVKTKSCAKNIRRKM